MDIETQANYVTPPEASTTPGVGVTCIAVDTTSRTYDLSTFTKFFGAYIDLVADGAKVYVLFDDDSTGSIDQTVNGAAGGGTAIADGTTEAVPWPLADGVPQSFMLQATRHRYLHVKGAAAGQLRLRPSSPASFKDR